MGKLLLVQCNRLVSGVQYPGISSIASHLQQAGHDFIFFDTADYSATVSSVEFPVASCFSDNPVDSLFKPIVDSSQRQAKKPLEGILTDLSLAIQRSSPDLIGFSCFSDDWPFAFFLIKSIKTEFPELSIIVGGVHAIVSPESIIAHPEVFAVCIGEGEIPLLQLLNGIDTNVPDFSIPNLWFNLSGNKIKNRTAEAFQFFNNTPFLNWDIYSASNFIFPFEGKLFRRGSYSISRGCPYSCSFCINSLNKSKTQKAANKLCYKEPDYAIEELHFLKQKHSLEFIRFWDENFLAFPEKKLRYFADEYKKKIGLPFTIETSADLITDEKCRIIAEMGCLSVSIGVETSNEKIRKEILKKNISNKQYLNGFAILSKYGIRKVANFMWCLPSQTLNDMYEDIIFCSELGIESPSPRIFYPYLGTELRDYCLRHGLVDLNILKDREKEDRVQSLSDLGHHYQTFNESILNFTDHEKNISREMLHHFVLLLELPTWMHRHLLGLLIEGDKRYWMVMNEIRSCVANKRSNNTNVSFYKNESIN